MRLSEVLKKLSGDNAFRDRLLQSLDALPDAWGLIGPDQKERLRNYILNRNWDGMDHFPGLTVGALNKSVRVADAAARRHPKLTSKLSEPYVELGPFSADRAGEADWDQIPKGAVSDPPIKDVGYGLTMGDGPNPALWGWHLQSIQAAQMFNRLSFNALLPPEKQFRVKVGGALADSPKQLLLALEGAGYQIVVEDDRFFANFGHMHFQGHDVIMPFWLDTRIQVPQSKQPLLVPVSHAENEIHIRSAQHNADVSFYYGIDGMAEFRTMDTLDQPWVGKNVAHVYEGENGGEAVRLLGVALVEYVKQHRAHPQLAFNGYYTLGVCQDVVAAVERRLTGKASLFPITHAAEYFKGKSELNDLYRSLPSDRGSLPPDWLRVRATLPVKNLDEISLPELREHLESVEREGSVVVLGSRPWLAISFLLGVLLIAFAYGRRRLRRLGGPRI